MTRKSIPKSFINTKGQLIEEFYGHVNEIRNGNAQVSIDTAEHDAIMTSIPIERFKQLTGRLPKIGKRFSIWPIQRPNDKIELVFDVQPAWGPKRFNKLLGPTKAEILNEFKPLLRK